MVYIKSWIYSLAHLRILLTSRNSYFLNLLRVDDGLSLYSLNFLPSLQNIVFHNQYNLDNEARFKLCMKTYLLISFFKILIYVKIVRHIWGRFISLIEICVGSPLVFVSMRLRSTISFNSAPVSYLKRKDENS